MNIDMVVLYVIEVDWGILVNELFEMIKFVLLIVYWYI